MHILIITPTKSEYEATVDSYDPSMRRRHQFHHITKQEQMRGYKMPLQIRFIGNWRSIPDAPTLEWIAQDLVQRNAVR